MIRSAGAVLTVLTLVACATPTPSAADYGTELSRRVGVDAMYGHLTKLQHIADENGGNRAFGTTGYDASVQYVEEALRSRGFDVSATILDVPIAYADKPVLSVGGAAIAAESMRFTRGTPPEGITASLVPVRGTGQGCLAGDYDGLPMFGAVALVDRGGCTYAGKEANAAARGAVALIIADNVADGPLLGSLGERTAVQIPAIGVGKADGARLRVHPAPVTLRLNAGVRSEHTRNVIAQTKTGSTHDMVMVGAHLDSVRAGPGINDDGSGVAAVLETALQLGSTPSVRNAVRFAFWAAEEDGVVGSRRYVESLDADGLKDIALYLNFDMIASPNPGYFTYDGDQSGPRKDDDKNPRVPEGSAGIERTLVAYLDGTPKKAEDTAFDGRSDYDAFTEAGIPSGGLFSGADGAMTAEQARRWGGTAGRPFDPNYHKKSDTVDHIDRTALEILGRGVAFAVGSYAQNIGGRNGVPARQDRTRHQVTPS
ncbi:Zn-dependent M28 family amino/carboxypeptidase [Mycobacterium sp. MAA66]